MRDPSTYAGQPVCPRCGSDWPNCVTRAPDGRLYTHKETCARYAWAELTCGRCSLEMAMEGTNT